MEMSEKSAAEAPDKKKYGETERMGPNSTSGRIRQKKPCYS
jgi:hypothetical protein